MATQGVSSRKRLNAMARSLERVVRPAPTERWTARMVDVDSGGGMMGAAAGKG